MSSSPRTRVTPQQRSIERLGMLRISETVIRDWKCSVQTPRFRMSVCLTNSSQLKVSRRRDSRGFPSHTVLVRLLGYTRVSTSSQDAQLQLDSLVSAGVQKRDVFADVTSGSKTAIERRGMKKLLEHAEPGDTVIVWRVDRLGRSLIDVLNTVNLLRDRGIHVRSISDGIDPTTSTGRLMLNMLATLAEYERELIVERVNAGIAAARQNGTRSVGPCLTRS
jgi:predicted site-specific integrase-resolvase